MAQRTKPSMKQPQNRSTVGYTFGFRRDQLDRIDAQSILLGNFSRYCKILLECDEANPKRLEAWVKAQGKGWDDGALQSYHRHASIPIASKSYMQARIKTLGLNGILYLRRLVDMDTVENIAIAHLEKQAGQKLMPN